MSAVVTLDQALDIASQLPFDQQEMLLKILHQRRIEMRRAEIAADAQQAIAALHSGQLRIQSAEEAIADLHTYVEQNP